MKAGEEITEEIAQEIEDSPIEEVEIRSVLTFMLILRQKIPVALILTARIC